jgi:hypothetical protein
MGYSSFHRDGARFTSLHDTLGEPSPMYLAAIKASRLIAEGVLPGDGLPQGVTTESLMAVRQATGVDNVDVPVGSGQAEDMVAVARLLLGTLRSRLTRAEAANLQYMIQVVES